MRQIPTGLSNSHFIEEILKDERWIQRFVERFFGWVFATLCTTNPSTREFWEQKAPTQVQTIRLFLQRAGEASVPASRWSVLTRLVTGLRYWLVQGLLTLLSVLGLLRPVSYVVQLLMERLVQLWAHCQLWRLKRYRWISMDEDYVLELHDR